MATGIAIDGVVQFGLSGWSNSATAVARVPSQYAGSVMRSGWGKSADAGMAAARARAMMCANGALIPTVGRPSDMVPALTCDMPGAAACNYGGAQSALSGIARFGDVSNFVCQEWAAVMTQLQVLMAKAEQAGDILSAEYVEAKKYFDDTSGPFQKPIFTCSSNTDKVKKLYLALQARLGGSSGPALPEIILGANTDKVLTAVKWGAVAVAVVAGAYALGPILRGVGGLIKRRRK